jgi:hypothetical protein
LAKKATKQKRPTKEQSAELARVNATRAALRRNLRAQRDARNLIIQCRRAYERVTSSNAGLLRFLALDQGFTLVPTEVHEQQEERIEHLEAIREQQARIIETLRKDPSATVESAIADDLRGFASAAAVAADSRD